MQAPNVKSIVIVKPNGNNYVIIHPDHEMLSTSQMITQNVFENVNILPDDNAKSSGQCYYPADYNSKDNHNVIIVVAEITSNGITQPDDIVRVIAR